MRARTGFIGAAALIAASVGIGGIVTSVQAEGDQPPDDFLLWNVSYGRGNQYFQEFRDGQPFSERQEYTSSDPWALETPPDGPALVQIGADGGEPAYSRIRQRHGVRGPDETYWSADTISGNEVLRFVAGDDLGGLFSGIRKLRLQGIERSHVTAQVTAKMGDDIKYTEQVVLGSKFEIVSVDVDFDGALADTVEFSLSGPGAYGISGLKSWKGDTRFDLVPDVQVVTPDEPAESSVDNGGFMNTATTSCDESSVKCQAGVPIEQQLFVDDSGVVNLDVIPLGTDGDLEILQTTLVREFPAGELPDILEIDYDIDGPRGFVPITPCSALPDGNPDLDPGNDEMPAGEGDPPFVPPACQVESIVDSSAPGGPIVETVRLKIAADPRMR